MYVERSSGAHRNKSVLMVWLITLGVILAACGPATSGTTAGSDPAPRGPKTLNIALEDQPTTVVYAGRAGAGGITTARFERWHTFHAGLTQFSGQGDPQPHIAQRVPTVENGDWKVNPDGTMLVTWTLRPDVYWHDGTRLTAHDFVFGYQVALDPRLAIPTLGELTNVSELRAVDDHTLSVSWKTLSIQGNVSSVEGLPIIPRHQVEEVYRARDPEAFEASEVWRSQFVGLGPYRVAEWQPDVHLIAEAFGQYFLGRPKIDRLVFRWIKDPSALVASVLAGVTDLVPPGTRIKPEGMVEIRRQWGPGRGVVTSSPNDVRTLEFNFRETGMPWASDVRVRQAMLHSLDKEQLIESLQYGFTDRAEYMAFPGDSVYRKAEEQRLPRYPYDPTRAQQLFATAGWTKGADGALQNATGQPMPTFHCCRYFDDVPDWIRESLAWGSHLKAAGVPAVHPVPSAPPGLNATETRQALAVGPRGALIANFRVTPGQNFASFTSVNIPREPNRWSGINGSAWTNPRYEELFERSMATLGLDARRVLELDMMKIIMDELPSLPVYYNPLGLVVREGVAGVGRGDPLNRGIAADIHVWNLN